MTVLLYDLAKKDPVKCWSLNPWKVRMILAYKGIEYKTQFLDFIEIAPTLRDTPLEPNKQGAPYTIPTICIDGKYTMDSLKCAQALEEYQPSPSLHLDDPMVPRVIEKAYEALWGLRQVFIPKTPAIVREESLPYFYESREKSLGMPLAEWGAKADREALWNGSLPAIKEVAGMLTEKPGPYFLGEEVSFADFFVVSFLHYLPFVDKDLQDRIMAVDEVFPKLYKACEKYLVRDDH